ncbi:hypothetical protein M441DRAFT_267926 [Trichoderma asperellum CBS 433.97]|uniref:Uncharacterized protein n=1 Tax=Trichoderma asperellum (strain ATCC 204424 / CBS 433.97 / NBRC 101777) TaxID=1042311 RepID=A0A2T3YVY7_TRIA4|nr:hypothetical protein M441DRAFT_267926 [Trichoderma asperellum CBS 433.97]PTB36694.1 hypothetical protein M441DRAFT_267926 [Trichoderma asperellum CBS 433.97]
MGVVALQFSLESNPPFESRCPSPRFFPMPQLADFVLCFLSSFLIFSLPTNAKKKKKKKSVEAIPGQLTGRPRYTTLPSYPYRTRLGSSYLTRHRKLSRGGPQFVRQCELLEGKYPKKKS